MIDLQDGLLQAYLDDELDAERRAAVEALLASSPEARRRLDALASARRLLAGALPVLDTAPPADAALERISARLGRRAWLGAVPLARAAVLVLLLAAGVSAAVPGSPVRAWLAAVFDGDARPEAAASAPAVTAPAEQPAGPASGVTIRVGQTVDVGISHGGPARVEIRVVPDERLTVTARDAATAPAFRTARGRIDVVGGEGGTLDLALPSGLRQCRVELNGRLVAEVREGQLLLHAPGERTQDVAVMHVR